MKAWSISTGDSASVRSTKLKAKLRSSAARASEASVRALDFAWARLTHNKYTTLYFLSSLIFCILITLFQISALNTNTGATLLSNALLTQANISTTNFAAYDRNGVIAGGLGKDSGILRICTNVQASRDPPNKCSIIWPVTSASSASSTPASPASSPTATPTSTTPTIPLPRISSSIGTGVMPTPTIALGFSPSTGVPSTGIADNDALDPLNFGHSKHSSVQAPLFVHPQKVQMHRRRLSRRYLPHPLLMDRLRLPGPAPQPQTPLRKRTLVPDAHMYGLAKRDIVIETLASGSLRVLGLHTDPTVSASTPAFKSDSVEVSQVCVQSVKWALQVLQNTNREDVASIFFQLWVLSMSIAALLNESVPYLLSSFLTQLIASLWAIANLAETVNFRADFNRVSSSAAGACAGTDLLPTYWQPRTNMEIVMLLLNLGALGMNIWLTYKLNKQFHWNQFKRIGASVLINKLYKVVLTLSVLIQLAFFFVITSVALWIDQLFKGLFAVYAHQGGLYKAVSIIAIFALLPWLALGWVAVRREHRTMMLAFLCLCIFYLILCFGMCFSTTFQLTFLNWRFFSVIYVCTFLLVLLTLVVAIMCRLNFGKGLPLYLTGEESGSFDDPALGPAPDAPNNDPEKVSFPSKAKLPQLGTLHRHTRHPSASTVGSVSLRTGSATAGHPKRSIGGDFAPGSGPIPPPIDTAAAVAGVSMRRRDSEAKIRKPRPTSVMLERAEKEGLGLDVARPAPAALAPTAVPIVPTSATSSAAAVDNDSGVILKLGRRTSNLARSQGVRKYTRQRQSSVDYVPGSGDLNPFSDGEPSGVSVEDLVEETDGYDSYGASSSGYHGQPRAAKVVSFHPSTGTPYMSREQMEERMGYHRPSLRANQSGLQGHSRAPSGGSSGSSGMRHEPSMSQRSGGTVSSYGTLVHQSSFERRALAAQPTVGHMDPDMSDDANYGAGGSRGRSEAWGATAPAKAFQKKRTQE